jgi:hypothetical protein
MTSFFVLCRSGKLISAHSWGDPGYGSALTLLKPFSSILSSLLTSDKGVRGRSVGASIGVKEFDKVPESHQCEIDDSTADRYLFSLTRRFPRGE